MATFRPRRSALYMPGSNARALQKAASLAADVVIMDLEDSVAPDAKPVARRQVCETVTRGGYGRREIVVRINGLASAWGGADIAEVSAAGPDAILVPKIQSASDVAAARAALDEAGAAPELAIWAMMETPLAVLNAHEIAAAAPGNRYPLTVLVMGTNDLAKETRAQLAAERIGMVAWLSACVAAARAYGLDILDGVYNDIRDAEGFEWECEQGLRLGMDGKTLIHPSQIEACNDIFSPSADEITWARKVLAAFALPENAGKGVITVDGRMVERLHAEMARRTVAIAEAVARSGASDDAA